MVATAQRVLAIPSVRQSIRYVLIGAIASTTDAACYFIFTRYCGLEHLVANFCSVNIGITVSFFLNAFLNFKKTERLLRRAIAFYGICYTGMCASMMLMLIGTRFLHYNDFLVKICSVMMVGVFQFLFNKCITFRHN